MAKTQDYEKLAEEVAGETVSEVSGGNRELTDKEVEKFAEVCVEFSERMTGIELHPYQREFAWRIAYSVLSEDSEEITALFSRQGGKCLARGTKVLMWDGSTRKVEDILVGDELMGDDSTPRRVLQLARGTEQMWEVRPKSGCHDGYTVNESHILSLRKKYDDSVVDVPVKKVLGLKDPVNSYRGYTVPIEFPVQPIDVDPYWLGLWLGDGCSQGVGITTDDPEIVKFLEGYSAELGMSVSTYLERGRCDTYAITNGNTGGGNGGKVNPLWEYLKKQDLVGNKHIPENYLRNSRTIRLKLLAGLIDSDGHRPKTEAKRNTCEILQKNLKLAESIQWLSRSLGFRASLKPKVVSGVQYWRVCLYGELWEVPTLIKRKQYEKCKLREDPRAYGFDLVLKGVDDYFGFEIDGNKRFILGDFTVTHNTEAVAVIVVGMMVLLPVLAKVVPGDPRISKFRGGLYCGIYAPNYEQSGIMWARMKARLYSNESKLMLLDPDIDIDLTGKRVIENMTLPNGSFCDCGTASPQSKIEGKTYHLVLLEECQDIPTSKIRASIHPMVAAVAGTLVKIGTCNKVKSDFYEACRRNKRHDVNRSLVRSKKRCHYEFDYTVVQRYNPRYRKHMEKERNRLGEDSDDFRMKYKLHWMLERGMFVNQDLFDECGIKENGNDPFVIKGKGKRQQKITFVRPPNVVTFDSSTENMVAAIDVGREASTIVTVGKVFWDGGVDYGGQVRYPIHVCNWLELSGDNHEAQHPQIVAFLKNYNISQVVVDATGKGDPVYSRLAAELDKYGIRVYAFIFSASSKDIGYKIFLQEISTRRFTFPAGSQAVKLAKWKRFTQQMYDLEKDWRGQVMVVSKPKKEEDARDDYPDSAMMLCWLVNAKGTMEIEEDSNPFFGREAGWKNAAMLAEAGAWFRRKMSPRGRLQGQRPGKSGRWDD